MESEEMASSVVSLCAHETLKRAKRLEYFTRQLVIFDRYLELLLYGSHERYHGHRIELREPP